jgi:hypothetical protein
MKLEFDEYDESSSTYFDNSMREIFFPEIIGFESSRKPRNFTEISSSYL